MQRKPIAASKLTLKTKKKAALIELLSLVFSKANAGPEL